MTVNRVILVGRVGQDPEIRYTNSGEAVVNISLATSEKWKNKDGVNQEETEWHRISIFSKLAEIANQYVRKGSQLYVEGKIKSKQYTDKNGIERTAFEIRCDTFRMLGNRPDESQNTKPDEFKKQPIKKDSVPINDMNDEIPF